MKTYTLLVIKKKKIKQKIKKKWASKGIKIALQMVQIELN